MPGPCSSSSTAALGRAQGCHRLNRSLQTGKGGGAGHCKWEQHLGKGWGGKDGPQLSRHGGTLGMHEKAVSNVLPQSALLSSSWQRASWWWLYLQLRRSHQGRGRGAGCQGRSSAKAIAPQSATEHRAEPKYKQHKQGFPETPQNRHQPVEGETPTALERPGSAGCCREERVSKGKPAGLEGSEWWPFHLGVTPVSGRNKTSLEQGAAVSPRLVNGLRINFLFTQ